MSELGKATDVTRQGLYKALPESGEPRLSTLLGVLNSLGGSAECPARQLVANRWGFASMRE